MDAVAIGELLVDFAVAGENEAGYPVLSANPGGAPANFLAALAKLGHKTAMVTKVGTDAFGSLLVGTLQQVGIGTSTVVCDDSFFTTLAFVTLDAAGERAFSFARKPGADTQLAPDEVDFDTIAAARLLYFGATAMTHQPCRSAVEKAVAFAKEQGKLVFFDPNLRPPLWASLAAAKETMLWGLAQADVVKISEEEVEFLFGACTPQEAAGRVLALGAKLVFVTLATRGCHAQNANGGGHVKTPLDVNTIDTTGAGDIFGGSAAAKLLELGKAPEALTKNEVLDIARYASAASSLSTAQMGGLLSVPGAAEVEALLARTNL